MRTMPWGEDITVLMELGFPADGLALDDPNLGLLDSGYLDGTLIGADVTEYVNELSISRGRSDQLTQFNAGTCEIVLNNNDRRFDPINESSPYWNSTLGRTGVVPRRKVTVKSGNEFLFVGKITDIDIAYQPVEPTATTEISAVTVNCADDFVLLANTFTEAAITPTEELSSDRVEAILDLPEVSYSLTSRDIETGTAILGGGATYEIPSNTNVLGYLNSVAESERGFFFVTRGGDLRFTKRSIQIFETPMATFSDAGDILYTNIDIVYGQELLYNKVLTQNVGGVEQIADDVASQTEYGISTLSLTNLLFSTDAQALTLAEALRDAYSEPRYRYDNLVTAYNAVGSAYYNTLSQLEIGKAINVTRTYNTGTPTTVTKSYAIEQVLHAINPTGHVVRLRLSPVDILVPLILDDPEYGTLSTINALGEKPPYLPFIFDQSEFDSGFSFQ